MFLQVQIEGTITNNWNAEYYHTPYRKSSHKNKPSTNDNNFRTVRHSLISHLIMQFFYTFLGSNNIPVFLSTVQTEQSLYTSRRSLHRCTKASTWAKILLWSRIHLSLDSLECILLICVTEKEKI